MELWNFEKFGSREREMAMELLQAWQDQGLPEGFDDENVEIVMNPESGYVFLTNAEYQVAMMNGDKLEMWYTLPISGEEGFIDDFKDYDPSELDHEDKLYLRREGLKI